MAFLGQLIYVQELKVVLMVYVCRGSYRRDIDKAQQEP